MVDGEWWMFSLVALLSLSAAFRLSAQPANLQTNKPQPGMVIRGLTVNPANQGALAPAPAPNQAPRDPFMSLMVTQPKIEIPAVPEATAAFDPPVTRPGELCFLRIMFNALEESIEWPTNLAAPPQLRIHPGAHGQLFQMAGTNMEPRTGINYRVRATAVGTFTLPQFDVKVAGRPVTVPAATLQVASAPPSFVPPAGQLALELRATNLFVGQAVQVRVLLPASPAGMVQGLGQPQISGDGILVDLGGVRQRIDMAPRGAGVAPTFVYETTLTPVMAGKLTVYAQGFTSANRFAAPGVVTGPATVPGALSQYALLESGPVELNVRPLPREGQLPGFTGAVGKFTIGPPRLATNVLSVGDPVKLTVTVTNRSDGPLARMVAPPPPQAQAWQVFAASDYAPAQPVMTPQLAMRFGPDGRSFMTTVPRPDDAEGVATFTYTLIPLTDAARATPPIPFSYFDPKAAEYVDLTIPSMPVTVKPGAVPGDFASLQQASAAAGEPEKELVLRGLATSRGRTAPSLVPPQRQAWFPVAQLGPALFFLGLWTWDRRRRYLETHPDVVLRRRARRALRRQWRAVQRAARTADAPRFATAAVNAMRVACAPRYPAEPRALVGGDVLPLLPETERFGRAGEVVRRFFAATDAARFGTAAPNVADLLPLKSDLERVLQELEQKL